MLEKVGVRYRLSCVVVLRKLEANDQDNKSKDAQRKRDLRITPVTSNKVLIRFPPATYRSFPPMVTIDGTLLALSFPTAATTFRTQSIAISCRNGIHSTFPEPLVLLYLEGFIRRMMKLNGVHCARVSESSSTLQS
jgi:hypothetical protein